MSLTKKPIKSGGDAGLRYEPEANARTAEPVPELEWAAVFGEFLRSIYPGARARSGAKWTELYDELVDSMMRDAGPGGRVEVAGADGGGRAMEGLGVDKKVIEIIKAVMGGGGRAMEEAEVRDRIGRRIDELFERYVEEKYGKDAWEMLNRRVDEFFKREAERFEEDEKKRLDEYSDEIFKRSIEEKFEEDEKKRLDEYSDEIFKRNIEEAIDRQIMVENFETFRREYMRMDILRSC